MRDYFRSLRKSCVSPLLLSPRRSPSPSFRRSGAITERGRSPPRSPRAHSRAALLRRRSPPLGSLAEDDGGAVTTSMLALPSPVAKQEAGATEVPGPGALQRLKVSLGVSSLATPPRRQPLASVHSPVIKFAPPPPPPVAAVDAADAPLRAARPPSDLPSASPRPPPHPLARSVSVEPPKSPRHAQGPPPFAMDPDLAPEHFTPLVPTSPRQIRLHVAPAVGTAEWMRKPSALRGNPYVSPRMVLVHDQYDEWRRRAGDPLAAAAIATAAAAQAMALPRVADAQLAASMLLRRSMPLPISSALPLGARTMSLSRAQQEQLAARTAFMQGQHAPVSANGLFGSPSKHAVPVAAVTDASATVPPAPAPPPGPLALRGATGLLRPRPRPRYAPAPTATVTVVRAPADALLLSRPMHLLPRPVPPSLPPVHSSQPPAVALSPPRVDRAPPIYAQPPRATAAPTRGPVVSPRIVTAVDPMRAGNAHYEDVRSADHHKPSPRRLGGRPPPALMPGMRAPPTPPPPGLPTSYAPSPFGGWVGGTPGGAGGGEIAALAAAAPTVA